MPALFDQAGVQFAYPENWVLDDASFDASKDVTVYSPGGAFWSLMVRPRSTDLDVAARSLVKGLEEEYEDLDVEPVSDALEEQPVVGYDVNFIYLDLICTVQVRAFKTARASYVLLWQAEDREFQEIEAVFRAMAVSLVRSLRG